MKKDTRERLLELCEISERCWMWRGTTNARGYGRLKVDGKTKGAHRLSYEAFIGPIPQGLFICHHCDEPGCINPEHLYAGTHKQNMKDMVSRRRHNAMKPFARSCENNPKAKLSFVLPEIRAKIALRLSDAHIARQYGVNPTTIRDIRVGKTWRSA